MSSTYPKRRMRKCKTRGCSRYYDAGRDRACVEHRDRGGYERMDRARAKAARRSNLATIGVVICFFAAAGWYVSRTPVGGAVGSLERGSGLIGWSPALESRSLAEDIHRRVNDERMERGLAPLVWNEELAALAREWSERMIETIFAHSPDSFRSLPFLLGSGENIAMGQSDTGELHEGWMRSDGHRRNLLMPEWTMIGVGVVCRNDGRMWATQIFGLALGDHYVMREQTMPPVDPIVRADRGLTCG